jgi:hypothetical protein
LEIIGCVSQHGERQGAPPPAAIAADERFTDRTYRSGQPIALPAGDGRQLLVGQILDARD